MGATHYVTMTTREYALLARLEGQARASLKAEAWSSVDATRKAVADTIAALDRQRNGGKS